MQQTKYIYRSRSRRSRLSDFPLSHQWILDRSVTESTITCMECEEVRYITYIHVGMGLGMVGLQDSFLLIWGAHLHGL